MKLYQKMIIGGVGATLTLLLCLLRVDLQTSLKVLTPIVLIGYIIKWFLLFGLGAFMVYLQSEENDKKKLLQIGITAPALILLYMNGNLTEEHIPVEPVAVMQTESASMQRAPAPAAMLDSSVKRSLKTIRPKIQMEYKETAGEQIMRGLFGSKKK